MARRPPPQLDLFAAPGPVAPNDAAPWPTEIDTLAASQHPLVHFGTSSWTFPGWSGLCYPAGTSQARLLEEGLALYARYPLFRTVGIDRSYYRPLARADLETYAAQLPPAFPCLEKVWDRITSTVVGTPGVGGAREPNPDFLSAELFRSAVHDAHVGVFEDRLFAYMLELPPMPKARRPPPAVFAEKLARFLGGAPKGVRFGVELRDRELLSKAYEQALRDHGATHIYNYWDRMPMPGAQLDALPFTADFAIARLLLRPGTKYDDRKDAFAPFDRIVDASDELRADMVRLVETAIPGGTKVFIIVNNKAEGSAPQTIVELARLLRKLGPR